MDTDQPQREMTHEEQVKDIRIKIDRLVQYAKMKRDDTRPEYAQGAREMALAVTKLEEAKMWFGKVFEAMGRELPKQYSDKAE